MQKKILAALLLAAAWLQSAEAAMPATQIADLARENLKRVEASNVNGAFLYAVLPAEQDIGIVHYATDDSGLTPANIDWTRALITRCNHSYSGECGIARKLETQWFDGTAFGARIWYSRDLAGNLQCYSVDGIRCVWTPPRRATNNYHIRDRETLDRFWLWELFPTYDTVVLETRDDFTRPRVSLPAGVRPGSTFRLDVGSTQPVAIFHDSIAKGSSRTWVYSGDIWRDGDFDPNAYGNKVAAIPLTCPKESSGAPASPPQPEWCATLRGLERTFHRDNVASLIERKLAHMDTLFRQYGDWSVAKVEADGNYAARLRQLEADIKSKSESRDWACGFSWFLPALPACLVLRDEVTALISAREALDQERGARMEQARAAVAEKRGQQWHTLHRQWAASDQTHFAALLKEESKALDELKSLEADYAKTVEAQHTAYLDAVNQYEHAVSPLGVLEHLPLIGPEIRHIEAFAKDPSSKNLRRMLLGLVGPVGETVEGVVELTSDESGLSPGETRFLTDMLGALTKNEGFTKTMEEVVGDAINDLGDEAIEGLRQVGLISENAGSTGEPRDIDYASIVDLRTRSQPVSYDPWTAAGEKASAFRAKFTPRMPGVTAYMTGQASYDPSSLTNIELASGGASFAHSLDALFTHAMGRDYDRVVDYSSTYAGWSRAQVNTELYKVVADPAYAEARRAYWVTSDTIGQRHAALLYDNDHAVIVLNSDLIEPTEDWSKYYIEELGHLVNWWRCDLFDIEPARCAVNGDVGARFRDAALVDPQLHDAPYETLLTELPIHPEVDRAPARFSGGALAWIDGWPSVYTISDRISAKASFSFLMRLGLDIDSEYPGISDEFDIELVIGAPKPAMRGNPWKTSANGYCTTDTQTDCNMPTMWMAVSFRDALKLGIASMPQVKSTQFGQSGLDLSPRLVRKHGGKLPFQLTSVDSTSWKYFGDQSIYFKKFTVALETKIDLWKMGHAMKGARPSSVHKPEFGAKAVPAEGSYVVEIATKDTADFAGWLAGDIASAILGCAGGFVVGLVSEQDPVTLCHGFSDIAEIVETAFELLDKKPTVFMEADGSVSLPSIEYKYATSGKKVRGSGTPTTTGRTTYHTEGGTGVVTLDEASSPATSTAAANPQVDSLKTKMRSGLSKLSSRSIKPIAVFRMRATFDYAQKNIRRGEYDLPSAVVTE